LWNNTDLAYLAGLIDGEGTIRYHEKRRKDPRSRQPDGKYLQRNWQVSVFNTNLLVLEWCRKTFGGYLTEKGSGSLPGSKKTNYVWWLTSKKSRDVITACLPYLKIKKQRAEVFLSGKSTKGV
jgi:hypothetical protein